MTHYTLLFESVGGGVNASVAELPLFVGGARTRLDAERAILHLLERHLEQFPAVAPTTTVRLARIQNGKARAVGITGLIGTRSTPAKRRAARLNGKLGGRPRARA